MIKGVMVGVVTGVTWVANVVAQTDPGSWPSVVVQGGAVALLAIVLYYIFAKITPELMKQRKEEHEAFMTALAQVQLQARDDRHTSEKAWRESLKEFSTALQAMSEAVSGCDFNKGRPDEPGRCDKGGCQK